MRLHIDSPQGKNGKHNHEIKMFLNLMLLAVLILGCDSFSMNNNKIAFVWNRKTSCDVVGTLQHHGRQHRHNHPLLMSTFQGKTKETDRNKSSMDPYHVVYQKVVKPSSNVPPILFLGYLVEYLQDIFTLPTNLPMVYEKQLPPENDYLDDEMSNDDGDRAILFWDSPLTPIADATRLSIEVVGIYSQSRGDNNEEVSAAPDMAMVVVRKKKIGSAKNLLPLMMKNLFDDSEKRIFRALDMGLDDFIAGRVALRSNRPYESGTEKKALKIPNVRTLEEALQAELMEEELQHSDSPPTTTRSERVVIDTVATRVQQQPTQQQKSAHSTATEDYAIRAAKKAAVLRATQKQPLPTTASEAVEDYAVKVAREQSQKQMKARESLSPSGETTMKDEAPPLIPTSSSDLAQEQHERHHEQSADDEETDLSTKSEESKNIQSLETTLESQSAPERVNDSASDEETILTKRPLNINYQDAKNSDPTVDDELLILKRESNLQDIATNDPPPTDRVPNQEQLEIDIAEAARQVLTEMADQGKDMSAEEMLDDVLKFGEQKDKENAAGNGFVSGAMEKAKELLRERSRQRDEKLHARGVKEIDKPMSPFQVDMKVMDDKKPKKLSAEEELRQMFEAGERLADGRISLATTISESNLAEPRSRMNDEIVDELIAEETTVSQHARVLDDELAELEVRINKSPGEELDGPRRNAIFDVFSGPEMYNPNVDPETAVNWPGALPGTKEVRLPRELEEAVQQAKFAADVLSKLTETTNENGDASFQLGGKEISLEQMEKLQSVASEAIQMGLIANPLELMAERSRLDIIIKEMWDQPEERFREIASNYKDLLLSDNFASLVRQRLSQMAERDLDALRTNDDEDDLSLENTHKRERDILGHLVGYAQLLLKEARALGAELEAQQLEVIRSICKVAMDPKHATEEETAMALTDAVRDMRPLLDDAFVAYLKYAVAEEEGRLARAGLLDDPDHNQWLFVLKIVQQGVYTEIARGINRYIEHIWYVLRMKTKAERRLLLEKLIDVMPTMDVRPFVQVVDNIVGALGDSARGEFEGSTVLGEMTNKLLQLHRDVKELLPPDRIDRMSRDADEWVAKQKQRLLEYRNMTKQRLKAARETEHLDPEIEALGRRGEMERMT